VPYRIRTTSRAAADIDAAIRWRSQRALTAAARWQRGLYRAICSLDTNPERCPLADEAEDLGLDLRELIYGRRQHVHRILFTIEGQTVIVHRVRHAAQDRLASGDI
jgi:plasmid stabilization system protein ParE